MITIHLVVLLLQLVLFNLLTRAFDLAIRAFSLLTRAFNFAVRAFSLLTR